MPFTTVKVIEGVFTDQQKLQLIDKITQAMIEVEGEEMRDKTWVVIEVVKASDWAIGGKVPNIRTKQGSTQVNGIMISA